MGKRQQRPQRDQIVVADQSRGRVVATHQFESGFAPRATGQGAAHDARQVIESGLVHGLSVARETFAVGGMIGGSREQGDTTMPQGDQMTNGVGDAGPKVRADIVAER